MFTIMADTSARLPLGHAASWTPALGCLTNIPSMWVSEARSKFPIHTLSTLFLFWLFSLLQAAAKPVQSLSYVHSNTLSSLSSPSLCNGTRGLEGVLVSSTPPHSLLPTLQAAAREHGLCSVHISCHALQVPRTHCSGILLPASSSSLQPLPALPPDPEPPWKSHCLSIHAVVTILKYLFVV